MTSPAEPHAHAAARARATSDPLVHALNHAERQLTEIARSLRQLRAARERELRDRGALGSRGLTQFILGHLELNPERGFRLSELQRAAQLAGYAVPNSVALTKRLSEHRARTGKIGFDRAAGWYWVKQEEGGGR